MKQIFLLFLLLPFSVLANTSPVEPMASPAEVATTTTTITTTSTTTSTFPAFAPVPKGQTYNFTSPLLNKIMHGQGPASDLPFWYGYRWNRKIHSVMDEWTEFLYKEIEANAPALVESTPEDASKFCPNYEKLNKDERILFWMKMMTVLMSFESGFSPQKSYDDTKNISGAKIKVVSSGLLMMSHESVMPAPYQCDMIDPDKDKGSLDLFDPKKNMACAVRMMNRWIAHDKVIADRSENPEGEVVWKGLPRYWGPFRHTMLKKDEEGLWEVLLARVPRWQAESDARDAYISKAVTEALEISQPIDKKVWEASSSRNPHPSMLDEKYNKEESHSFSSIVRLMNQTAFCYK